MIKPEPTFAVPLSALVEIDRRWWGCRWCSENRREHSRAEAVSAAIAHLADEHGIYSNGQRRSGTRPRPSEREEVDR